MNVDRQQWLLTSDLLQIIRNFSSTNENENGTRFNVNSRWFEFEALEMCKLMCIKID